MLGQAQHERGGVTHRLMCHPDTPTATVTGITVACTRYGDRLEMAYRVAGDLDRLAVEHDVAGRTDGLWRHTCFEAFVAGQGAGYREFNFAPAGAWAAYAFDSYRGGMRDAEADPVIAWDAAALTVNVALDVPGDWRLNLTAVIEEVDGTKSYWALAHPDGQPDFHDRDCFLLALAAP